MCVTSAVAMLQQKCCVQYVYLMSKGNVLQRLNLIFEEIYQWQTLLSVDFVYVQIKYLKFLKIHKFLTRNILEIVSTLNNNLETFPNFNKLLRSVPKKNCLLMGSKFYILRMALQGLNTKN